MVLNLMRNGHALGCLLLMRVDEEEEEEEEGGIQADAA
jgi:hypothetical protein